MPAARGAVLSPVWCLSPSPGSPDRVGCARWRARRRGSSGSCGWATVQGQHSTTRSKGGAGDEEGKLPIGGWQQLEATVHLGCISAWFAGHARERPCTTARWHQGWPKGCSWWQRWRWGGRRVVHGVDLGHTAGQVAQEPGAHLSVDALAGGEKPRHLVHALTEASTVLAQHRGVCTQRGCGGRGAQRSAGSTGDGGVQPTDVASCSPPEPGIQSLWQHVLCSRVPRMRMESMAPPLPSPQHQELSWGTNNPQKSSYAPKYCGSSLGAQSPQGLLCLSPHKTDPDGQHSSAGRADRGQGCSPPSALQYQGCRRRAQ